MKTRDAWAVFFLFFLATSCAFAAPTVGDVQRQLDLGHPHEAYRLARKLEAQEAGDPTFDFYYGLAAQRTAISKKLFLPFSAC